jgi:hypothetical protein
MGDFAYINMVIIKLNKLFDISDFTVAWDGKLPSDGQYGYFIDWQKIVCYSSAML